MPKMGGPELAEALTRRRPAMKVLLVSGYTDQAIVDNGVLGRGVQFLSKPFSRARLLGRVRAVLRSKE
jgi:FixJ family two-component response regulator